MTPTDGPSGEQPRRARDLDGYHGRSRPPESGPRPDARASERAEAGSGRAAAPTPAADGDGREARSIERTRVVILVSAVVLALSGLALAFFLGTRLSSGDATANEPSPTPTPTASPTPTPTPTPAPSVVPLPQPQGPVPPGEYRWDELGGGECIEPYTSPWEERFVVVPCDQPHRAQLVVRGSLSDDPAAPYPGEADLTGRLGLLCSSPEVIDYARAEAYSDVQLQAAYPPDEESWGSGQRSYFCFATLADGGSLTDTIAAP